jgi:two-component system LytT family response regulator
MKIRAIIVDDELLGRERIAGLLQKHPEIEVIAECENGTDAVIKITEETPDLVFLDVQMPELDGFGVLASLELEVMPAVIFVTAHDKFALKAFEVHALDYLLKPFDRERFDSALQRALNEIGRRQSGQLTKQLTNLIADLKPERKGLERLTIKADGRIFFIKVEDVDWIEAADNYVTLHVGPDKHMMRETMASLENKLPEEKFVRISRSAIVNMEVIKEMQPLFHGDYAIILKDGTKLTLSRNQREKLQKILGKVG